MPPSQYSLEQYPYKVFVSGKSGVGKTSTVAKLTGNEIPATHSETPGELITYNHMTDNVTAFQNFDKTV